MDLTSLRGKGVEIFKKYRYFVLILLIGIGFMLIPGNSKSTPIQPSASQTSGWEDQTEALTQILSQIKGAGKVRLMLTLASGEETVYQTNSNADRQDTVTITDSDRAQQGLIQTVLAPKYRGAVVVCQGADDVAVRLAIVEAVSSATGLGASHISVLKMK